MRVQLKQMKSWAFIVGFTCFSVLILVAIFGPVIFGIDPAKAFDMQAEPFIGPSSEHFLGTNALGQDAFSLLLLGMRTSFYVGLLAGLFATILGTAIGIAGGYKGGIVDNILSTLTNLLIVVPQLIILVLLSGSVSNRSYLLLSMFIGATAWVWVARALRAQAASLRSRDHVNLAKLNGFGTFSILAKQILPYVLSYVFMAFVMQLGAGIFAESALSMLGLGPRGSDVVSLGTILHQAGETGAYTDGMWWIFLPPTLVITVTVYSLYLINTSLENVFNPRLGE